VNYFTRGLACGIFCDSGVLKNLAGHSDMQIEASTDPARTQREKLAFFASQLLNWLLGNDKGLDPKKHFGPFPAVNAQEREIGKRNCAIGIP
jgi:hypothetical protein